MDKLPDYTIKRHPRAKRLKLKVTALGQLEVVAPRGVVKYRIEQFVNENTQWINDAIEKCRDRRLSDPNLGLNLPEHINLIALNRLWKIQYIGASKPKLQELDDHVIVYHQAKDEAIYLLHNWLLKKARAYLVERLE